MHTKFQLDGLDHVGITARDMEASAKWYQECLGLKRYDIPEWGGAAVFLLAGRTGIALFPAGNGPETVKPPVRIDHFAFTVSRENLQKAMEHYDELGLEYQFKDHIHFHSVYTKDPDGHIVELTALITDEAEFYGD